MYVVRRHFFALICPFANYTRRYYSHLHRTMIVGRLSFCVICMSTTESPTASAQSNWNRFIYQIITSLVSRIRNTCNHRLFLSRALSPGQITGAMRLRESRSTNQCSHSASSRRHCARWAASTWRIWNTNMYLRFIIFRLSSPLVLHSHFTNPDCLESEFWNKVDFQTSVTTGQLLITNQTS